MAAVILFGCQGPEGDPGRDGVVPDTEPPSVEMVEPLYGDTLDLEFTVHVRAGDNVGIDRILFYLNGSAQINDTTQAVDSTGESGTYSFTFNATEMGMLHGQHTLAARAFDESENTETTPTVIVTYFGASENSLDSLAYFGMGNLDYLPLNLPIDTLFSDSLYNVRFHPPQRCVLDSVYYYITQSTAAENNHSANMNILVMSSNGIYPDQVLTVEADTLADDTTDYWQGYAFSEPDTFDVGERFHIGLELDATLEDSARTALKASELEPHTLPIDNHSGYYHTERGHWVTFQEGGSGTAAPEIWMFAVVRYVGEDGQTAGAARLLPDRGGSAQPLDAGDAAPARAVGFHGTQR
ncbi:hypothetical protein GF324_10905 [bacterium]|nr:hypothetical protein [bacterium]